MGALRPSGFAGRGSGRDFFAILANSRVKYWLGDEGNKVSQYGQSVLGSTVEEIKTKVAL